MHTKTWKLNNTHLNYQLVKEEIKDFLKFNETVHTTYSNLWYTMKAVLRRKFIALNTYIKRLENPTLVSCSSTEIRNKTRLFTLSISIQYS